MFRFTKRVLSLIFASVLLLNLLQTNAYTIEIDGDVAFCVDCGYSFTIPE